MRSWSYCFLLQSAALSEPIAIYSQSKPPNPTSAQRIFMSKPYEKRNGTIKIYKGSCDSGVWAVGHHSSAAFLESVAKSKYGSWPLQGFVARCWVRRSEVVDEGFECQDWELLTKDRAGEGAVPVTLSVECFGFVRGSTDDCH